MMKNRLLFGATYTCSIVLELRSSRLRRYVMRLHTESFVPRSLEDFEHTFLVVEVVIPLEHRVICIKEIPNDLFGRCYPAVLTSDYVLLSL